MATEQDWIEDVAQETAIQLFKSLQRYDPDKTFLPWVHGIARHMASNHWRKQRQQRRQQTQLRQYLEEQFTCPDALPTGLTAETSRLSACLEQLPAKHRRVVELRYYQQKNSAEVARDLETTADAVRQSLVRIREALRRCLEARPGGVT
jgi:RNA polymerase sigma-70 factor (ECF subfamily)